jgi:HAD superfamily hydrolase (TIGR01549 family)
MAAVTYEAWLVDLDGTLYHQTALQLAMALELAVGGWSAISCIQAFRDEHERLRGGTTEPLVDPYRLQIERTAARLGCPAEHVRRVVTQWMIARPCRWLRSLRRRGLLREIAEFRERGGKTALVSDYPAQAKLEAMGIAHFFDVVIASGESTEPLRLKPWPDGYLLAAQRLQVSPAACLVIGDRPDADGQSARRAGMAYRRV